MSGKGDQVSLKPEGFSVRSNEGKLDDNVPRGGGKSDTEYGNGFTVSSSCFGKDTFHTT